MWEDEYKDALMRGMPRLDDGFKITIIVKKIATDSIRKEMEAKIYASYADARADLMHWAREKTKRAEEIGGTRKKKDTDVQMGGINSFGESTDWGLTEQNDALYDHAKEWDDALIDPLRGPPGLTANYPNQNPASSSNAAPLDISSFQRTFRSSTNNRS